MKHIIILFTLCLTANLFATNIKNLTYKFDFGSGKVERDHIQILNQTIYNNRTGFGFDFNTLPKNVSNKGKNKLVSDYCTDNKPFYFSVAVPDGVYRVTVILGNKDVATSNTIKAESRRLMAHNVKTKAGKSTRVSFNVSVRTPLLPSGGVVRLKTRERDGHPSWDNKLTLEFNGENPSICALEITRIGDVKTVFICGDSTTTDQRNEPWSGWGMMLPYFFNDQICIANLAESGETLKAFRGEKRLEKVLSMIQAGDYMLIQFAHNDMKKGGAHSDANTEYKEILMEFANAAIAKGAHPVFITSMHRRAFDKDGFIINTLEDYPKAMKEVGRENNIPVIDLNAMSQILYETLGVEGSKKAFVHYPAGSFPNQEKPLADNTHFNAYGAMQLAKCLIEGIKTTLPNLAHDLKPGFPSYDASVPDDVDAFHIPASPVFNMEKPEGN